MRYAHHPADGQAITLDDLAAFVAEMRGYRELPGNTVVRAAGVLEVDIESGPRIARLTADTEPSSGGGWLNRAQRRAGGQRGPRP